VECQVRFRRGKASRLNHLRNEIGPHLHDVGAQQLEAPRHREVVDEDHRDRDDQGEHEQRPRDRPDRTAAGRHDDELAVAVEPVEDVDRGDEKRDGRNQSHEVRQRQQRHLDEKPRFLALRGDEIELL
jgi:hypothetical protein